MRPQPQEEAALRQAEEQPRQPVAVEVPHHLVVAHQLAPVQRRQPVAVEVAHPLPTAPAGGGGGGGAPAGAPAAGRNSAPAGAGSPAAGAPGPGPRGAGRGRNADRNANDRGINIEVGRPVIGRRYHGGCLVRARSDASGVDSGMNTGSAGAGSRPRSATCGSAAEVRKVSKGLNLYRTSR